MSSNAKTEVEGYEQDNNALGDISTLGVKK
jgi:hypothetical protein